MEDAERALAEVDWDAIDAMTSEDIERQIAENPDAAPIVTDFTGWKRYGATVSLDEPKRKLLLEILRRSIASGEAARIADEVRLGRGERKPDPADIIVQLRPDEEGE